MLTGPLITEIAMVGAGIGAGIFGSLLGLGGGVLIVPLLTLGFGMGVREAAGVSLVAVIVTSSAAASVYLQRHTANLRLGMSLELFTAIGALVGVLIAFSLSDKVLAALFALLLGYTAFSMARKRDPRPVPAPAASPAPAPATPPAPAAAATPGPGSATAPATGARGGTGHVEDTASGRGPFGLWTEATLHRLSGPGYHVHHLGFGIVGAFFAGILSAILGIGGGIVKVPVMHLVMGVPLRVATATSNLMIGVTGTAGAISYLLRGGIDPYVAGPIAAGVFIGATLGTRLAPRVDLRLLRLLFVVVMAYTSLQMVIRAVNA